jgi:hypothetical protein
MFTLPKDWKIYYNSIRERCRNLIDLKIWGGIEHNQFNLWRKNFQSDEEKYFAACIMDSLVYRSNEQTLSLIHQLLYRNLNNAFRILKIKLDNFPKILQDPTKDPLIRLVPVIKQEDPVTKSSNEILRFMKRYFQVSEKWIINPWNIEENFNTGTKLIIFIDDFLGTGEQFDEVSTYERLGNYFKKKSIIYSPLVAHELGIGYLKSQYADLTIVSSEKLEYSKHSFFNNYFIKEVDKSKEFYLDLLARKGIVFNDNNKFGYGNLELTYAFEHAAPDNSLHILHHRSSNWNPLFNR